MTNPNKKPPYRTHNFLGYKIHHYDHIVSTNEIAKETAKKTKDERIVILADTQTEGKGRLGRLWLSPKGGIWLSIILRPKLSPKEALKLTLIASLAIAKTLTSMFELKAEIKWPNDILVDGKKICGILTEASTRDYNVEFAVVGIGINANIDLATFPSNLQDIVTTLKHELGSEVKLKALLKTFLQSFERNYTRLQKGWWRPLLQEWKDMASFLGEQVEVSSSSEVLVGKALDVDDDGALILRLEDGVLKKIVVGDVTVRRL